MSSNVSLTLTNLFSLRLTSGSRSDVLSCIWLCSCVFGSGTRRAGWTASWTCSLSSIFSTASRPGRRSTAEVTASVRQSVCPSVRLSLTPDSVLIFTMISLKPHQPLVAPPLPPPPPFLPPPPPLPPLSDVSQLLTFTSVQLSSFCSISRSSLFRGHKGQVVTQ